MQLVDCGRTTSPLVWMALYFLWTPLTASDFLRLRESLMYVLGLSFVLVIFRQALLTCEELANVPFLILGNKIDLGRAASEEDLRYQLGLYETYGKETKFSKENNTVRPIELYMCSVVRKMGYGDGFKWLAQFL